MRTGPALAIAALALGILAPAFSAPAHALEAKKSSDTITVSGGIGPFGGPLGAPPCPALLATRAPIFIASDGDGTASLFSVPDGKVFVITSWDWYVDDFADAQYVRVNLYAAKAGESEPLSLSGGPTVSGQASGSVVTPAGSVVKPGTSLCASTTAIVDPVCDLCGDPTGGGFLEVVVRGYLAPDK
jgi:hypothetical protein